MDGMAPRGDVDQREAADGDPYRDRTFIILNPVAGRGQPDRIRRQIGGAFAARGAAFDLVTTTAPGHAVELATDAARLGYRAVCVVGGDGTLAEAASGLIGCNTPLAVLPRGTANQVAQNLRLPNELEAAVDVVLNGRRTPLDLGRIDGRAFALIAGAGLDAAVMAAATRSLKERWGFGAYVYATLKEAFAAKPADFTIVADGQEIQTQAVTVMLANVGELFAHFLPFGLPLAPQPTRSWQDGLLDVVVLAPRNLSELVGVLWRAARRDFTANEHLIHFQAREVVIHAEPEIAVQIDGDAAGHTPMRAVVVPQGVTILTPQ